MWYNTCIDDCTWENVRMSNMHTNAIQVLVDVLLEQLKSSNRDTRLEAAKTLSKFNAEPVAFCTSQPMIDAFITAKASGDAAETELMCQYVSDLATLYVKLGDYHMGGGAHE
jgi:hypothetical protein